MATKLDPIQIQRASFDEDASAVRVSLAPTQIAVQLDHADGDSVYSHKKMQIIDYKAGQLLDTSLAEVICCTDHHEGSFGELPLSQIRMVMEAWRDRVKELSKLPYVEHVFPFENRGEEVGVTLNHPHGQIYAYSYIPPRTEKMLKVATDHLKKNRTPLLTDIIARELKDEVRLVATNAHWIAYVPFAARYPFEIHIAPRKFVSDLAHLSDDVADDFPEIAKEVLMRLDGVFGIEMAYIAAWHQAPVRVGRDALGLHLQITSIRRAPGKLKYLAGSESAMGAFIMDMKPEQSAAQLRDVKLK